MVEALMAYDYGIPLIILTDTGYAGDNLSNYWLKTVTLTTKRL